MLHIIMQHYLFPHSYAGVLLLDSFGDEDLKPYNASFGVVISGDLICHLLLIKRKR